jgi:hypothetical protein
MGRCTDLAGGEVMAIDDQITQASTAPIPPPPSGFSPESSTPMTNNPLSAGVDTSPTPPPPPGFVPETTIPATGLQRAISSLKGEDDPEGSWYPELGDELSGAVKSAANGLGGIADWINKPRGELLSQPSPESIRDTVAFYQRIHPQATKQEAAAFVEQAINSGKQPFSTHLTDVADWLRSGGQPTGFFEHVGAIGEQALEWLGGDGLLKLASAPAKAAETAKAGQVAYDTVGHIAQAGQIARVLQDNPKLAGFLSLGIKASRDAIAAGTQNYLHTEDPTTATETGVIAGALSGTLRAGSALVSRGIQAIKAATDTGAVQDALQGTIHNILGNVADATNVPKPVSSSLRDVFSELGDNVAAKAQSLYKKIDDALTTEGGTIGTNYKTYDQQIQNVRRAIRMDTGIDSDYSGKLLEREGLLVDAKQKALDMAAAQGVPSDTGAKADELWRMSKSLQDIQSALNQSVTGLRSELTTTATQAAPEEITATFAKKLNALYTSGRLADALSPKHADDLLRAVEVANLQAKRVAASRALLNHVVKAGAVAGAGAVGALGIEGAAHAMNQ